MNKYNLDLTDSELLKIWDMCYDYLENRSDWGVDSNDEIPLLLEQACAFNKFNNREVFDFRFGLGVYKYLKCNKCGGDIIIDSEIVGYEYTCLDCDEDLYSMEVSIIQDKVKMILEYGYSVIDRLNRTYRVVGNNASDFVLVECKGNNAYHNTDYAMDLTNRGNKDLDIMTILDSDNEVVYQRED